MASKVVAQGVCSGWPERASRGFAEVGEDVLNQGDRDVAATVVAAELSGAEPVVAACAALAARGR